MTVEDLIVSRKKEKNKPVIHYENEPLVQVFNQLIVRDNDVSNSYGTLLYGRMAKSTQEMSMPTARQSVKRCWQK